MCERTELPTDAIEQLFDDIDVGDEYGPGDSTDARAQFAALQAAAQGMTLDDARKVLPSSEWGYDDGPSAVYAYFETHAGAQFIGISKSNGLVLTREGVALTRKMRDAAEEIWLRMQGDSAEARALREEYKG